MTAARTRGRQEFAAPWLARLAAVNPTGPEDEALEVSWITLDEALAAVAAGTINDAKSLVGIYWLARLLAH